MGAVDLRDPQTLNLYAYCANDPVNYTDPSGLGFFSFFKKLFGWVAQALKWIAVAVTVAVVVLSFASGFGVPGAAALLKALTGVLSTIGGLLSKAGLGFLAKAAFGGNLLAAGAFGALEGGTIAAAIVGLGGLQAAGAVGAVANYVQRRRRDRRRRRSSHETADLAALAALREWNPVSKRENREYAGSICKQRDDTFIPSPPNPGGRDSSTPSPCPDGTTRVATYHTHGSWDPNYVEQSPDGPIDWNETFSGRDRIVANNRGVPDYLGTPKGKMKVFNPAGPRGSINGDVQVFRGVKLP
jgi:hypothetical protein